MSDAYQELVSLLSGPALIWAPKLTLLFFLASRPWGQYGPSGSFAEFLVAANILLVLLGLLLESLALHPVFWFVLCASHFLWIRLAYHEADNHRYLEGYWCVAMALALYIGGDAGERVLELDASLLIGCCFAFAVLWKAINPRYRDGSFFAEILLTDERFIAIAYGVGGLTQEERDAHRRARSRMRSGSSVEVATVSPRLLSTAIFLTWWTLAIETAIAAAFLIPVSGLEWFRWGTLLTFFVSTYTLVPVAAFGQVLLLMLLVTLSAGEHRVWVLGILLASTVVFQVLSAALRKWAERRLLAMDQVLFGWTDRARDRHLTRDGDDWEMVFTAADLRLSVEADWADAIRSLLDTPSPFSIAQLPTSSSQISKEELSGVVGALVELGLLNQHMATKEGLGPAHTGGQAF